jgi:hypothetical protein
MAKISRSGVSSNSSIPTRWSSGSCSILALATLVAGACTSNEPQQRQSKGLPVYKTSVGIADCASDDGESAPPPYSEDEYFCLTFLPADLVVEATVIKLEGLTEPLGINSDTISPQACQSEIYPAVDMTLTDVVALLGELPPSIENSLLARVPGSSTRIWSPGITLAEDGLIQWKTNVAGPGAPLIEGTRIIARLYRHPETGALAAANHELFARGEDEQVLRQLHEWRDLYRCGLSQPVRACHEYIDSADFQSFAARVAACKATDAIFDTITLLREQNAEAFISRPSSHSAGQCGGG